jgi:putative FmdB family regulatory protein
MPTYGYKCDRCGHELEAFQKMSDAPLRTCPSCGKDALRRQVYAAGVLFKGSGFYKTDYAAKKPSEGASNGSSEKSSSESKPASGGDKAPAASD